MASWNMFFQQYLEGRVLDKYRLENGNIGLIVEQGMDKRRYHVEFKDRNSKPGLNDLYGLYRTPFSEQTDQLDKLVKKGDYIGVSLSYENSPFRQAQQLHSISSAPLYRARPSYGQNPRNLLLGTY